MAKQQLDQMMLVFSLRGSTEQLSVNNFNLRSACCTDENHLNELVNFSLSSIVKMYSKFPAQLCIIRR